jgi:hypothetical protein
MLDECVTILSSVHGPSSSRFRAICGTEPGAPIVQGSGLRLPPSKTQAHHSSRAFLTKKQ